MASFTDSPPEIIEEIIDALQDDLAAVKSCSRTCRSLLPLCRKYIFRTVSFIRLPGFNDANLTRRITLFGNLLDSNAKIADYVQNLLYEIHSVYDVEDDNVLRVLDRLHQVRSFQLSGSSICIVWTTLRPRFQKALLRLIHLRSVTRLRISFFWDFPVTTFLPCVNLIELAVIQLGRLERGSADSALEYPMLGPVPQLQSFAFDMAVGQYAKAIFEAKRSDGLPMLDFSNLRTLDVYVRYGPDFEAVEMLLQVMEKLETLHYRVKYLEEGCRGLAAWMNQSSSSTLKRLHFVFGLKETFNDPLCGLCEELAQFAGANVIEEITVEVYTLTGQLCSTDGEQWGRLDAVLSKGFPMLRQLSLNIDCRVDPRGPVSDAQLALREQLNKLPKYFPWLTQNTSVTFHFSTALVDTDDDRGIKY